MLEKAVWNVTLSPQAEVAIINIVRNSGKFARAVLMLRIEMLSAPALQAFLPLLVEWKDREGLTGDDAQTVAAAERAHRSWTCANRERKSGGVVGQEPLKGPSKSGAPRGLR